jgi:hypothetical protein
LLFYRAVGGSSPADLRTYWLFDISLSRGLFRYILKTCRVGVVCWLFIAIDLILCYIDRKMGCLAHNQYATVAVQGSFWRVPHFSIRCGMPEQTLRRIPPHLTQVLPCRSMLPESSIDVSTHDYIPLYSGLDHAWSFAGSYRALAPT